ncbi:cytochrome c family protein, partial [Pseudomonas sp. GW460-13]
MPRTALVLLALAAFTAIPTAATAAADIQAGKA